MAYDRKLVDTNDFKNMSSIKDAFLFLSCPLVSIDKGVTDRNGHPYNWMKYYAMHANGKWYGCDGYRAHIIKDDDLLMFDDGLYCVSVKTKSRVVLRKVDGAERDYPNIESSFPKETRFAFNAVIHGEGDDDFSSFYTRVVRQLPEGVTLRASYVKDVLMRDMYWEVRLSTSGNNTHKICGVMFVDDITNRMAFMTTRVLDA